jgi:hypothetical protein
MIEGLLSFAVAVVAAFVITEIQDRRAARRQDALRRIRRGEFR